MSAAIVQTIILTLVATTCVLVALQRLLPASSHRLQAAFARVLSQPSRSRGVRALGTWLQPDEAKAGACGSGGGCGSCGGCGVASSANPALRDGAQPLVFNAKRGPLLK